MKGNQKSKNSSKISKLDREINFISQNLQASETVKEALPKIKKDKKRSVYRRQNKDFIRRGPKKVKTIKFQCV